MKLSEIRYALYRCKNNCADEMHQRVFNEYKDQLEDFGFTAADFAEATGWGINKKDTSSIVTGRTVKKYIDELLKPL